MAFDPTTHPYLLLYVPNLADVPTAIYKNTNKTGGNATAVGDNVGSIEMPGTGGTVLNSASGFMQVLADAGGGVLAIQGASGKGIGNNSTSALNTIHVNRKMWFYAVFKQTFVSAQNSNPILDNTNLGGDTTASRQGVTIAGNVLNAGQSIGGAEAPANGTSMRVRIKNSSTDAPIINLVTEEDLASEAIPSVHVLRGYVTPTGVCYAQVDNGRRSYKRVSASSAGSGDASNGYFILQRASFDQHFPGMLLALGVYSDYPGAAAEQDWLTRFPLGNIAGSPEVRVGDFHVNLSPVMQYSAHCLWWKDQRISPMSSGGGEDGEGAVFNDGVSSGGGWVGGPHKNEVLIEVPTILVDGNSTSFGDGQTYEADGSVIFERHTEMGVSFYLTERTTWQTNSVRTYVLLTRRNDGRTISSNYMIRHARAFEFADYQAFDIDGGITKEGTISTTANTVTNGLMPRAGTSLTGKDTIAVAQWNPSTGQMALAVMLKGYSLNHDFIIVDDTYNKRIYNRCNTTASNGQTLEMECISKFYEATAGTWKALALSELQGLLATASGGRKRMGLGLGMSYGARRF